MKTVNAVFKFAYKWKRSVRFNAKADVDKAVAQGIYLSYDAYGELDRPEEIFLTVGDVAK